MSNETMTTQLSLYFKCSEKSVDP